LDVTDDQRIAAFFAIYDYEKNVYVAEAETPGVIFRIDTGERPRLSLQHLKETNLYSRPFYVSGVDAITLFDKCASALESEESLGNYAEEKRTLDMSRHTIGQYP
jgi:hypothetical protein